VAIDLGMVDEQNEVPIGAPLNFAYATLTSRLKYCRNFAITFTYRQRTDESLRKICIKPALLT
jgi:hypothetical protein